MQNNVQGTSVPFFHQSFKNPCVSELLWHVFYWALLNCLVAQGCCYRILEDEHFLLFVFFLLEAQFMPHVMCSSSPLFKSSFNISVLNLLMGFYIIFIIFFTKVSDCFKTNEHIRNQWPYSQNSFEMNDVIICHFSWAWMYREIKVSCDYGCFILNIYNFYPICPNYVALHGFLYI